MQKQMLYNVEMDNKYKDIIDIDYEKIKSSWGSNISIEDRAAQTITLCLYTTERHNLHRLRHLQDMRKQ